MLFGLSAAQYTLQQKNISSSRFFASEAELHRYAESGIALAVHEVNYNVSVAPGKIGTANWDETTMDSGMDGQAATADPGEGDGLPTPGEPGVFPVTIGPASEGIQVVVHAFEPDASGTMRVVATSFNSEGMVTVEKRLQRDVIAIPRAGAVLVEPDVALDLKGERFTMDGRDHAADGTLLTSGGTDLYGLATMEGATPGANAANLLAQVPSSNYDQIIGEGGSPSIGESPPVDLDALANAYVAAANNTLSGTISDGSFGSWSTVSYADSNLHLSGAVKGKGVLVVDGDLTISGEFTFAGLIIVRGDIRLVGGGTTVHTIGAVIVQESITAVEDSEFTITGTADMVYSSEALDLIETNLKPGNYEGVFYNEGLAQQAYGGGYPSYPEGEEEEG